jgi:thioredoxin-related protein
VKHYTSLLIFLISLNCFAQEIKNQHSFPGINDWQQTIEKAKRENKTIMVDLSTEWCTWCKVMDKKIFTDPEVLSLMQPKLNSYILDAEKDSIGQLLKLKYGIAAYPSFLFFTSQGEYLETWSGSMPKEYWVQYIKDSIDVEPMKRPGIPTGLSFQWPDFVQKEIKANFKKSAPSDSVLTNYFLQCNFKNFIDFNVCRFYPKNIPDSLLGVMLNDKEWLNQNYGEDIVNELLSMSINWKAYGQIQNSNWSKAWYYMNQYAVNFPQNDWELFNVKLFYFESKNEVDSLIKLGLDKPSFVDEHIASEIIEFICEHGKTKEHFKQAELWNQAELRKTIVFKFAKYQAQICFKLSDIEEAKRWAKIALEKAKNEGVQLSKDDELNRILSFEQKISRDNLILSVYILE